MNARAMNLAAAGIVKAAIGRTAKPAPTVANFIAFVRAHPGNPYPNIGWAMTSVHAKDGDDLAQTRRRLTYQLPTWKQQVVRRHWAADPGKVSVTCIVLDLMDEFFGEAA